MSLTVFREAKSQDATRIRALLEDSALPTSDLESSRPQFVVACDGERIVGVGALQSFGSVALLRSVAVDREVRSRGLGRGIVRELERVARSTGVAQLVLLTQTARDFFEHRGYGVIGREAVPDAIQGSAEFRTLCPASAVCMFKRLERP
jgi:amino-acid N-acetyltransferase